MESLGKEKDLNGNVVNQGNCGLREQRLNRPACLCAATAGRHSQFLCHIHRGIEAP